MKISQTKKPAEIASSRLPHTDLACESIPQSSTLTRSFTICGFDGIEANVKTKQDEHETGRRRGRYMTLFCPFLSDLTDETSKELSAALGLLLKDFISGLGVSLTKGPSILVAGLGNRFITSDAIGPKAADKILATAHLNRESKSFSSIGAPSVSIIAPGVSSQSGFDSFDIIRAAAHAAKADLVIAIDALASRSTERLCSTIQISDSGIHPGSGIGNHRAPITKEAIGIPVIAIGVPTVISSATLVYDALEKAGSDYINHDLSEISDGLNGFFVSPGDSDTICQNASEIIAEAIENALLEKLFDRSQF